MKTLLLLALITLASSYSPSQEVTALSLKKKGILTKRGKPTPSQERVAKYKWQYDIS